MTRLDELPNRLRGITNSEVHQILKLFGIWPVPAKDFEIPDTCLSAIWLADYAATMGILDQATRSVLLELWHPRMVAWGPDGPPKDHADKDIRIADRKFVFFTEPGSDPKHMDLSTGQVFTGLPKLPPVEKLILDIYAIFIRRRQEVRHAHDTA